MKDYSFQGKAYLATRDANGKPQGMIWVGDASTLQIALSTETMTRQESFSGKRLESVRSPKSVSATFTLTLSYFSAQNLGLGLYGNAIDVTTGTVTAEALPADSAKGDFIALDHRDVSELVITDSTTANAKTLVEGTDYSLDSAAGGIVQILGGISSYVQPLNAAYSYAAAVNVPLFAVGAPERYLIFDGINTIDQSHVKARFYRCQFDPASQLDLISSDVGSLELKGGVLYDELNAADSNFGGFGRIELAADAT